MRIVKSLLTFGVIFGLSTIGVSAQDQEGEDGGKMTIEFQPPKDSALKSLAEALEASEFFTEMADGVNETYHLPRNLPVYFRQCDTVNAFYDRNKEEMTICYELVARFKALFDANEG